MKLFNTLRAVTGEVDTLVMFRQRAPSFFRRNVRKSFLTGHKLYFVSG